MATISKTADCRDDDERSDLMIASILQRVDSDVEAGRNIGALPKDLAALMFAYSDLRPDPDEEIEGEVSL